MQNNIDILLLDNSNNILEEANIERPKTYEELNVIIKKKLKNLAENYSIFYPSKNNNYIEITNNEEYQLSKDILFIHNIDKEDLHRSTFEINYNKLPEEKKEKIDEKYCCSICSDIIKKEKPFFCYVCQKIFHHKCLIEWDKQKGNNQQLKCPICRNELPLKKWKEKLNYEENRKNEGEIMNQINELNNKNDKITEIIKYYQKYLRKISKLLINVLNKISEINSIMQPGLINKKLNNLIQNYSNNLINPEIDDISNVILEEFNKIIKFNVNIDIINKEKQEDSFEFINEDKQEKKEKDLMNQDKQEKLNINNSQNNINDSIIEYKNEINLIYINRKEGYKNIFGEKFVQNNYNNISLIVNEEKSELRYKYLLKEGENIIKMIINNHSDINLSHMFERCSSLKNIDDLKYLDTKDATDFSYMFSGCINLSDISSLKYWNISNNTDFQYILSGCSSLYDITPLKNWNTSKCKNFQYMFNNCELLTDITPLKDWDVENGTNFSFMFNDCLSLNDLSGLDNWYTSNSLNFQYMFCHCKSIKNLHALRKWSVAKCKNFSYMFCYCLNLDDITGLKNWNVSNGVNFNFMFSKCSMISNVAPLRNWVAANGQNYDKIKKKFRL